MFDSTPAAASASPPQPLSSERFVLWIDQVGAFLVCLQEAVSIGGPAVEGTVGGTAADVSLLAHLSRRHATVVRSGERYVLQAHAPAFVAGRPAHDRADLCDGYEITLGSSAPSGGVRFRFCLPTVASGTARLDFLSDHRPQRACDALILMDQTCLLGPTAENHVRCQGWPAAVLLYRQEGRLFCKSRNELFIDGCHAPAGGALNSGSTVTGPDLRFRLERV